MSQPGTASTSTPPPLPTDPSSASTSTDAKPEIPWAFIDCSADTVVILISHMLNLLIEHNDQVVLTPDALTRFHSRAAPGISVIEYLRRIVKYTNMEKIPLLSLLAYIDLTCAHLPTFTLSTLTVHRFLIAGVCAGSKAQCDVFCTNSHYAKVGGIKVQELNALEREFLRVTQWNLCCNADLLQRYYTSLIKSHGGFTQAPPPAVTPFRAFPRSVSKPRTPEEDGEDPMDAEEAEDDDMGGDGEAVEDDEAVGGLSGGEEGARRRRKSVDHLLGISAEGGEERGRGRRRNGSPTMEVEPPEQYPAHTPQRQSQPHSPSVPATNSTLNATPTSSHSTLSPQKSRDAPISPASSSIPSSSRSSIRLGRTGRAPSLTNLAGGGRPAEAVLDRRHAGMKGTSTPDVLGGQVVGASVPEGANLGRGSTSDEREPAGHRYDEPDIYEEEAEGDDAGRTANGGTGPGHGRLLKNIVGVFRKRSSVPPPPYHVPDTSTPLQPGHRPHSVIPSRPLSAVSSAHTATNPTSVPAPKLISPIRRHPGTDVRPPPSPRDTTMAQQIKSPGMPNSVTPRIRTRDERSVESLRDRNGVGVGIGMD